MSGLSGHWKRDVNPYLIPAPLGGGPGMYTNVQGHFTVSVPTAAVLDAGAVTDEGGGNVGIPMTAHPFADGQLVIIAGTVAYDGAYTIADASNANKFIVKATYVAEVLAGTETVKLYKTFTIVGAGFTVEASAVIGGVITVRDSEGNTSRVNPLSLKVFGHEANKFHVQIVSLLTDYDSGDELTIWIIGPDKAYDITQDILKTIRGNPEWRRYTSAVPYFTAVTADTTGAIIDVQGFNTLEGRYVSSNTAGMHGALLFYSSYDNGTSFERIRSSIPTTRNRSGLLRLDCAAYTHVRADYNEIAATAGELTLSIQKANQPLSFIQEARPPIKVHLRESAILTANYVASFLIDVDGYTNADIVLIPNVAVDGGQIEMKIWGAYTRGGTLVRLYSVVGVGTVIAGADIQSKLQPQRLIYEPVSDTDEDPLSHTINISAISQLSVTFRDPSGVGTLTTLESEVALYC